MHIFVQNGGVFFMQRNEMNAPGLPHLLVLRERKVLELEGVSEVGRFDEQTVELVTTCGVLTLYGENLHVRRLDLADGLLTVEGRVDGMAYSNREERGGFLRRILR